MKIVAGSPGNDAIEPLAFVDGGVTVEPAEWGPRAGTPIHFDCVFLASHGWLRGVELSSGRATVPGGFA